MRVVTREKEFIVPTDGIAAQREFYSRLEEGPGSLDDLITAAESEYAGIYHSLLALNHGTVADSHRVARLVVHLAMRGSHLRDTLSLGGERVLTKVASMMSDRSNFEALMGFAGDSPSPHFRESLNKAYAKNRRKFAKAKISRFAFQDIAFKYAKSHSDEMFGDLVPFISMLLNFNTSEAAASGHKQVLTEGLEPRLRVETLSGLPWHVLDVAPSELALPDSIAIAHTPKSGVVPVAYLSTSDEAIGVIFPLSTARALCGGTCADKNVLQEFLGDFKLLAASCSWNFLVLDPGALVDARLSSHIGSAVVSFFKNIIEEGMQKMLAERLV